MLSLIVLFIAHTCRLPIFRGGKLGSITAEYKQADMIIFVGGGYLRTNPGFKQSLNLLMHLVMFWFAMFSHARQIVAPISFGPFAHKWQERLSALTLAGAEQVFVREQISQDILAGYLKTKVKLSTDTALFIKPLPGLPKVKSAPIIGFTIRRWGSKEAQSRLIAAYVFALGEFATKHGMKVRPIVQVDGPEFGETDQNITAAVAQGLLALGIDVLPVTTLKNVIGALEVYGGINILLGMRMHSNILASVQGVPFVAVSYEHKTEGIARMLNQEQFCIGVGNVTKDRLFALLSQRFDSSSEKGLTTREQKTIEQFRVQFIGDLVDRNRV
jgi:colanic acid/amylovoran biosynthesis protein